MSPRPADSIEPGSLEALRAENQALRVENQILKDEIARLKGLPSRPPSKRHRPSGMEKATDPSGSKNRTGRRKTRGAKRDRDRVTREVIVKAEVPAGSRFKGLRDTPGARLGLLCRGPALSARARGAPSGGADRGSRAGRDRW